MSETTEAHKNGKTYFVYGSGLMAVPPGMINEIPRLKREFHASEVSLAVAAARTRKIA